MSLVGKFVFISNGPYYKFGQVLEATDEHNEFFLVKIFSPGHKSDTLSLYNISQMMQIDEKPEDEDERVVWIFFSTQRELSKYVKKVEKPPQKEPVKGDGKVIQFIRGTYERT